MLLPRHTQESYKLIPGLYRGLTKTTKRIPDDLWERESDMFYEFRSKAKELHNHNLNDWDLLFLCSTMACEPGCLTGQKAWRWPFILPC